MSWGWIAYVAAMFVLAVALAALAEWAEVKDHFHEESVSRSDRMTLDEAVRVGTLLYWTLGLELSPGRLVTQAEAESAATWLAKRAGQVMPGMPSATDVLRNWPVPQPLELWGQKVCPAVGIAMTSDPHAN